MKTWSTPRRRVVLVVATVAVLLAFVVAFGVPWGAADVSSSVTDATLSRLAPGMTMAQVRTVLGEPLLSKVDGYGRSIWSYSRPVPLVRWYPEVGLLFVEGRLEEAWVKHKTFWGVDSELHYWMRPSGERWTSTGFSANDW